MEPLERVDLTPALTFELADPFGTGGWGGTPPDTVAVADEAHAGAHAARLTRGDDSPGAFTAVGFTVPIDFTGERLTLSGWLRRDQVVGQAGLWQRQEALDGTVLAFENLAGKDLAGTEDWRSFSVTLPIDPGARRVVVGALLAGTGTVWVDDLALAVDGVPLAKVPVVALPPPPVVTSGVTAPALSPAQVADLVTLAKVWGFVKYHHPALTRGERDADAALFEVLPRVLAAADPEAARAAIDAWVAGLGEPPACRRCAVAPASPALAAPIAWLHDEALLGPALSERLLRIYAARPTDAAQRYVGFVNGVGNPDFSGESAAPLGFPDDGYRLLAAFRLWNIGQWWSPNRDVLDPDWDAVLAEVLPAFASARDDRDYHRALLRLIWHFHDTHANLWSDLAARPPEGPGGLSVGVRFVDGAPVVDRAGAGLAVGDRITALDGVPIAQLLAEWAPYYPASNEAARQWALGATLLRGPVGPVVVSVVRADGAAADVTAERVALTPTAQPFHDHPGPAFRRLSPAVAYLSLARAAVADVPEYLRAAAGAEALVLDLRDYPSEFVVWALARRLVAEPTPWVQFTHAEAANPGAFVTDPPGVLKPKGKPFAGKIAVLVDEVTISQAEYTAMALAAVPGALVVGGTTAGADGNVSEVPLPGGQNTYISGLGIRWPDGAPTQRVGIAPDVLAAPTAAGLAAGRDEVLDAAVVALLGRPLSADEAAALTR